MVGPALVRRLKSERCEVLIADRRALDLTRPADTQDWLRDNRPDVVIVAAARVGGIAYNNAFPVDFLADDLAIELNVIGGSFAIGVRKLLFLGSSCIPFVGRLERAGESHSFVHGLWREPQYHGLWRWEPDALLLLC
jgi:GDP-L-fucose synthase